MMTAMMKMVKMRREEDCSLKRWGGLRSLACWNMFIGYKLFFKQGKLYPNSTQWPPLKMKWYSKCWWFLLCNLWDCIFFLTWPLVGPSFLPDIRGLCHGQKPGGFHRPASLQWRPKWGHSKYDCYTWLITNCRLQWLLTIIHYHRKYYEIS